VTVRQLENFHAWVAFAAAVLFVWLTMKKGGPGK